MAKKKVAKSSPAVCVMRCKHLGDANVSMLTLPREHKEAFRQEFEKAFKDVGVERDSNKIKSGIYCDTDTGSTPYATAILIIPPVFPSKMQLMLSDFCQRHGLKLNPYIPDPEQE